MIGQTVTICIDPGIWREKVCVEIEEDRDTEASEVSVQYKGEY